MRNLGTFTGLALLVLLGFFYMDNHRLEQAVKTEVAMHQLTKVGYREAQALAEVQDTKRLLDDAKKLATTNDRIRNDFEARLSDLRLRAQRLRPQTRSTPDGSPPVLAVSTPGVASSGTPDTGQEAGLSTDDALIASEQALQLQGLLNWFNLRRASGSPGTPNSADPLAHLPPIALPAVALAP